jgi:hypothetical protein
MSQPHRPTTAQEIFNTVAMHLLVQGRKAVGKNGKCVYRSPNGDRCAVGVLISDEEYLKKMEGKTVVKLLFDEQMPKRLLPHVKLLAELQAVHDYCCSDADSHEFDRDELLRSLRRAAESYGLECDVLAVM